MNLNHIYTHHTTDNNTNTSGRRGGCTVHVPSGALMPGDSCISYRVTSSTTLLPAMGRHLPYMALRESTGRRSTSPWDSLVSEGLDSGRTCPLSLVVIVKPLRGPHTGGRKKCACASACGHVCACACMCVTVPMTSLCPIVMAVTM